MNACSNKLKIINDACGALVHQSTDMPIPFGDAGGVSSCIHSSGLSIKSRFIDSSLSYSVASAPARSDTRNQYNCKRAQSVPSAAATDAQTSRALSAGVAWLRAALEGALWLA